MEISLLKTFVVYANLTFYNKINIVFVFSRHGSLCGGLT